LQRTDDLPDRVMMVDVIPFSWLFPRVAAVMHRGGVGTTSAGLRVDVSSVIVPFSSLKVVRAGSR
jgi:sterol 3beta-glucosyltransferase